MTYFDLGTGGLLESELPEPPEFLDECAEILQFPCENIKCLRTKWSMRARSSCERIQCGRHKERTTGLLVITG